MSDRDPSDYLLRVAFMEVTDDMPAAVGVCDERPSPAYQQLLAYPHVRELRIRIEGGEVEALFVPPTVRGWPLEADPDEAT